MTRKVLFTLVGGFFVVTGLAFAGPGHDHGTAHKKSAPLPNCPVMDEPINFAVSTKTDDGPLFFCCNGCVKKYKAEPTKYSDAVASQRKALAKRDKIQTACPVSGEPVNKKVSIEKDGKKIHFCCKGCVSKYEKEPSKYAAALANSYTYQTICPVMGQTIDPTSFTALADGRKIFYCCDGCEGPLFKKTAKYAKNLASQGFEYNWAKIKEGLDEKGDGHGHKGGHDHHKGHGHDGHEH